MTKAELARKLGVSRAYVTMLSNGIRKPSHNIVNKLNELGLTVNKIESESRTFNPLVVGSNPTRPIFNLLINFLNSRRQGLSPHTLKFYQTYLYQSLKVIGTSTSFQDIKKFLDDLQCSNGGKHAYFRAIRAFCNHLFRQGD